ncbi:hypothetical protein [Marinovum sp.]|uniref:hypothetical protein n=1 Tax=Marinovum sp. TaxID=2024839 RepID=UPI003A8DB4C4
MSDHSRPSPRKTQTGVIAGLWSSLADRRHRRQIEQLRRDPRMARDIGMDPLPEPPQRRGTLLW